MHNTSLHTCLIALRCGTDQFVFNPLSLQLQGQQREDEQYFFKK